MAGLMRMTGLQLALKEAKPRIVKNQGVAQYFVPSKVHVQSQAVITKAGGPAV